jgi:hypothetical protein
VFILLRPLILAGDKKVRVIEDYDADSDSPTYLELVPGKGFDSGAVTLENYRTQNVRFDLYLNIKRIAAFHARPNSRSAISFEELKNAFLVKELSLIRYGAAEYLRLVPRETPYTRNQVWEYLFLILELRRCRYRLSFELPAFSYYIGVYHRYVRTGIGMEMVREDMSRFQHILREFEKIRGMLETVYRLAILKENPDSDIASYALPWILAAERQDALVSAQCSRMLYNFILQPNELNRAFRFRFFEISPEPDEELEDAPDEPRPSVLEDEAEDFYREVLGEHREEIVRVRNVFKRFFTATHHVETFDGDVNLRRQQQLYLDSITGDPGRNFLQRRFRNTTMDVVILRDTSFSTDLYKIEYAASIITILAALEGIPSVRTAQIDFSDYPRLNKVFKQPLSRASIAPEAFGATRLAEALDIVESFNFRADKRLVFLVSDGEIEEPERCAEKTAALEKKQGLLFLYVKLTLPVYGSALQTRGRNAVCSFDMLSRALFELLRKDLW